MEAFLNAFWNERFWLPANTSWTDLQNNTPGVYYPQLRDLMWCIPCSIILCFLRWIFERYVFRPVGLLFGLKELNILHCPSNKLFDREFKHCKRPTSKQIDVIASASNCSTKEVHRWFRKKRNCQKSTALNKFCESGWKFIFYCPIFFYGLYILHDKEWFKDISVIFDDYPFHSVKTDMFLYYVIELAYYLAGVFTVFSDVRRKDFWELFVHHIAAISLMIYSWTCNFVRLGALVLCLHDCMDYWLELAKMSKYVNYERMCNFAFLTFTVGWAITRLFLYPVWILYTSTVFGYRIFGGFPAMYIFNCFMILLQILHIIWFTMMCRCLLQVFNNGQVTKDDRSDSEMSEESDADNHKLS